MKKKALLMAASVLCIVIAFTYGSIAAWGMCTVWTVMGVLNTLNFILMKNTLHESTYCKAMGAITMTIGYLSAFMSFMIHDWPLGFRSATVGSYGLVMFLLTKTEK